MKTPEELAAEWAKEAEGSVAKLLREAVLAERKACADLADQYGAHDRTPIGEARGAFEVKDMILRRGQA